MRNLKRIAALGLAVAMTFALTACGSSAGTEAAPAETTEAAADETAAAETTEAATEDAAAEEAAPADGKVYQIATDTTFAPFEFENDSSELVGIDMDLLKAIAEDQGFQYEVQSVGFNAAMTALEAGEVDGMIAGMSITDERKEKYDFSFSIPSVS